MKTVCSAQLTPVWWLCSFQLAFEAIMLPFTPQPLPVSSLRALREDEMERGKWDLNRLRCHLALVYRLSLPEGRGSTLGFSSQAQFTAGHSQGGVDAIGSGVGEEGYKKSSINSKWVFWSREEAAGDTHEAGSSAEQSFNIMGLQYCHHIFTVSSDPN